MSVCVVYVQSVHVQIYLCGYNIYVVYTLYKAIIHLQAGQSFQPSLKQSGSRDSNLAVVGTEVCICIQEMF